jgi:hypothetical protein
VDVAEPTVRITIGRVEIKATTDSPKPEARVPASKPTLSLEDYLHEREGGGRK